MRIRRQTVEHPFGTIKAWMSATHFLVRTIERVSTEMSLHVLAYNMKRVITLLGSVLRIHARIANAGNDFLHKASNTITRSAKTTQ